MQKKILYFILAMVVAAVFSFGICSTSHAYTEEEKAQAKAWLSAHGYSPDAGGASQAYQDYLDGKFDEELGITTTEATTNEPAATAEENTEADEGKKEKEEPKKTEESSVVSSENLDTKNVETSEDEETGGKTRTESETSVDEQVEEETKVIKEQTTDKEEIPQTISVYRKENMDTYKEAGMVIVLSVLLMVVIEGAILLIK